MAQNLLEYKCPCCGGAISFDASLQKLKCPYCDTEFDVETLKSYDEALGTDGDEEDLQWDKSTMSGREWDESDVLSAYACKSCGGELVCDATTAATHCPYCGNPIVLMGRLTGTLKPDYVIPFRLDKEKAKEGLYRHFKNKPLLPKSFKSEATIDEIKGVYVPFWLFDATADANVRYRATRVRFWSDSDYNYTETSHYAVSRAGNVAFERVPVDGSSKMADDLMESIEPYDFSDAVDFQTAYLAGYLADKYDVTVEQSIDRANERIRKSTEETFASTVQGYNSVIPEHSTIRLRDTSSKYALYPVWLLNTDWKGTKYTFAMNGQTGKFVGNLPLDKGAMIRWIAGLTLGVGAAVFAVLSLIFLL